MTKILVVDDEAYMLRLVQFNLERAGYSVITAKDGQEALEILEKEKVDLIITDVMMPRIDGFELCKRVKTDARWKSYPVIMLTAMAQVADRVGGKAAGADDYITKPFHPKKLLAIVESALKPYSNIEKESKKRN